MNLLKIQKYKFEMNRFNWYYWWFPHSTAMQLVAQHRIMQPINQTIFPIIRLLYMIVEIRFPLSMNVWISLHCLDSDLQSLPVGLMLKRYPNKKQFFFLFPPLLECGLQAFAYLDT